MATADMNPEIPAITALVVRLEISIRVLQVLQLVAEKLFNCTNCLKGMRPPQSGQDAIWLLCMDIGFRYK